MAWLPLTALLANGLMYRKILLIVELGLVFRSTARVLPMADVVPEEPLGTFELRPEQSAFVGELDRLIRSRLGRLVARPYACLARAHGVRTILARRNIRSELRIGVSRCDSEDFMAHAWLIVGGHVIVGPALPDERVFRRSIDTVRR